MKKSLAGLAAMVECHTAHKLTVKFLCPNLDGGPRFNNSSNASFNTRTCCCAHQIKFTTPRKLKLSWLPPVFQAEVTIMVFEKKERLTLGAASLLFALIGLFQLWRAFAQVPVVVAGNAVPIWPSFLVGAIGLFMAFMLCKVMRHHRPIV